jgi:DNA-binding transcriptional ArsR family regulator
MLDKYVIVKSVLNQSPATPIGEATAAQRASLAGAAIDVLFAALADPTRRAMVDQLSAGPASVSELARPLAISLPAVLQHLHVLERSGLVRSHKVGRVRTCSVEGGALGDAERWIAQRRAAWEQRLDRLGEYLAEQADEPEQSQQSNEGRPA